MAVGRIGMSIDDFCRCTPLEFSAIAEGWNEGEQHRQRAAWERTRMQCTCMLQPYSSKSLEPTDVMCFAWDGDHFEAESEKPTANETWERFKQVIRKQGLG